MPQRIPSHSIPHKFPLGFRQRNRHLYRYPVLFILSPFLTVGLMSDWGAGLVIAREMTAGVRVEVAQQSNSTEDATKAAAEQLLQEGMQAVGYKAGEALTLYNIAYLERTQGNLTAALTQINAALEIIETLGTQIASEELRASYFATVQNYHQFKIDLLMELHQQNPK